MKKDVKTQVDEQIKTYGYEPEFFRKTNHRISNLTRIMFVFTFIAVLYFLVNLINFIWAHYLSGLDPKAETEGRICGQLTHNVTFDTYLVPLFNITIMISWQIPFLRIFWIKKSLAVSAKKDQLASTRDSALAFLQVT